MLLYVAGVGFPDGCIFRCRAFVPPSGFLAGWGNNWLFDFVGGLFRHRLSERAGEQPELEVLTCSPKLVFKSMGEQMAFRSERGGEGLRLVVLPLCQSSPKGVSYRHGAGFRGMGESTAE